MSSSSTFIYHERQQALLCGQHALNNLVQTQTFTPGALAEIAHQLDQMELNYMSAGNQNGVHSKDYIQRIAEGSGNVDESGNFSIEVLRSALLSNFDLTLANIGQENIRCTEITNFEGFICNKASHWFAIRKINDRYWNLNSTKERPELISHFRLAAEIEALQNSGYSVFVVVEIGRLPRPAMSREEADVRGSTGSWWSETDLISGVAKGVHVNHWTRGNVGGGMRLDGKSTAMCAHTAIPVAKPMVDVDSMTEEEMLQMALAASIQPEESTPAEEDIVELSPEPSPDMEDAVRLQFRLPDGKKSQRRFLKTESTKVLKTYVLQCCHNQNRSALELRAGFPPKIISFEESIESANLSGEQIQCRFT
jgi:ataxin-3